MTSNTFTSIRDRARATVRFFTRDVWEARLDELPSAKAARYQGARMVYAAVHGLFLDERHQIRAAALTYFTVLSIVPLLAFVFALLKGFGAYDLLVQESIRPYVLHAVEGNPPLRTAFEQILGFVDKTGVTSLGLVGLLALLYAATRLLRNIEVALNAIWGVRSARGALEQLRDYLALIVITPICLMVAAALTTLGQALSMLRSAGEVLGLSALVDPLIGVLGPLAVLFAGLTVLYMVMPHTHVRPRSAFVGAVVGGIAWFALLIVHVKFQVGVARFNALYSSFGAIPIFLAWLQISWMVILVGAQVAATHQQSQRLGQQRRMPHVAQAAREAACLSVMLRVSRAFANGDKPPALARLSTELDVPEVELEQWLQRLVDAGWLATTRLCGDAGAKGDDGVAYVLAMAPERIRAKHVLDALRVEPKTPLRRFGEPLRLDPAARQLWIELDGELAQSAANRSFRELAAPDVDQSRSSGEYARQSTPARSGAAPESGGAAARRPDRSGDAHASVRAAARGGAERLGQTDTDSAGGRGSDEEASTRRPHFGQPASE